jgi:hypothetical protein
MASRKSLLIGLVGLASATTVIALAVALLPGDGEEKGVSTGGTPLSAGVAGAQQTATVAPATATPVPPTATLEPEPTPLPERTSCEEIRGTEYRSEQERQFFIANCVAAPAAEATANTGGPQPAGATSCPTGELLVTVIDNPPRPSYCVGVPTIPQGTIVGVDKSAQTSGCSEIGSGGVIICNRLLDASGLLWSCLRNPQGWNCSGPIRQ